METQILGIFAGSQLQHGGKKRDRFKKYSGQHVLIEKFVT